MAHALVEAQSPALRSSAVVTLEDLEVEALFPEELREGETRHTGAYDQDFGCGHLDARVNEWLSESLDSGECLRRRCVSLVPVWLR